MDHLSSLPLGLRAKPALTREQKAKETEKQREINETMRSCGFAHVRDNPNADCLFCSLCGRDEKSFEIRRCTGCRKAAYCSKACQTKDWPNHKRECDQRLEKVTKLRKENSARQKFHAASFKGFEEKLEAAARDALVSLTPPTPGTLWGVVSPELFGVIPDEEDDPLIYQLLSNFIQDFVESKTMFSVAEKSERGELVIAKCEEEESYARAVVVNVSSGGRFKESDSRREKSNSVIYSEPIDERDLSSHSTQLHPVVDLWFIDLGCLQRNTLQSDLIPIRDFWDDLRQAMKTPFNDAMKPKQLIELQARLIPCFLQATDPNTGESRRLVPSREYDGSGGSANASPSTWASEAITMIKRCTSYSLDVAVKDKVLGSVGDDCGSSSFPFTVWGVELTKDLGVDLFLDVGACLYNDGWADLEGVNEAEGEEDEVKEDEE